MIPSATVDSAISGGVSQVSDLTWRALFDSMMLTDVEITPPTPGEMGAIPPSPEGDGEDAPTRVEAAIHSLSWDLETVVQACC